MPEAVQIATSLPPGFRTEWTDIAFQQKAAGAVLGIAIAIVNASLHLMFVGAYPIWSLTIIAIDAAVIWALTTHPAFEETPVQR